MNEKFLKTRMKILEVIKKFHERGEIPYMSQIFWETEFTLDTISRHVHELEKQGIVETFMQGGRKYIKLKRDPEQADMVVVNNVKKWTDEEVEFLKKHYGKIATREIAEALGRSIFAVYCKAKRLGLTNKRNGKISHYLAKVLAKAPA